MDSQQKKKQFPNCPRCQKNATTVDPHYGVMLCKTCQTQDENETQITNPEFYNISKQERIQEQRDKYKGDLAQPWTDGKPNPVFARTYPDKLQDFYTDEEIASL